jgi:hypothetical protein
MIYVGFHCLYILENLLEIYGFWIGWIVIEFGDEIYRVFFIKCIGQMWV